MRRSLLFWLVLGALQHSQTAEPQCEKNYELNLIPRINDLRRKYSASPVSPPEASEDLQKDTFVIEMSITYSIKSNGTYERGPGDAVYHGKIADDEEIVQHWYEKAISKNRGSRQTDFVQLISKSSRTVHCVKCSYLEEMWLVCRFAPPENADEFADRARLRKRQPTDDAASSQMIEKINRLRERHNAPELKFDPTLKNQLISDCVSAVNGEYRVPSEDNEYASEKSLTPEQIVQSWYDEGQDYDYSKEPTDPSRFRHFTQLVWNSSKRVACHACARPTPSRTRTVCRFAPAGNVPNEYVKNTFKPNVDSGLEPTPGIRNRRQADDQSVSVAPDDASFSSTTAASGSAGPQNEGSTPAGATTAAAASMIARTSTTSQVETKTGNSTGTTHPSQQAPTKKPETGAQGDEAEQLSYFRTSLTVLLVIVTISAVCVIGVVGYMTYLLWPQFARN